MARCAPRVHAQLPPISSQSTRSDGATKAVGDHAGAWVRVRARDRVRPDPNLG